MSKKKTVLVEKTKHEKITELKRILEALDVNSEFRDSVESKLKQAQEMKDDIKDTMSQIDKNYRFELLKEYKVSVIYRDQEFCRVFTSRQSLMSFINKLNETKDLNVTVTSRSIYVV